MAAYSGSPGSRLTPTRARAWRGETLGLRDPRSDPEHSRSSPVRRHRASWAHSESSEAAKGSDVSRKPLTLIAQLPELPHLGVVHRWPTTKENRHPLVAIALGSLELFQVEP